MYSMTRIRTVRKYGNSYYIALSVIDMKDLRIEEGAQVDISDISVIKKRGQK